MFAHHHENIKATEVYRIVNHACGKYPLHYNTSARQAKEISKPEVVILSTSLAEAQKEYKGNQQDILIKYSVYLTENRNLNFSNTKQKG